MDTIIGLTPFELWNVQDIDKMCASAATAVVLDCSDGSCTPCADEISFMFTRYANFLDTETTKLYTQISGIQATMLQASNNFNGISKELRVSNGDTAQISLP
jgi:hypothetical protein